jgi:hypothetical protein
MDHWSLVAGVPTLLYGPGVLDEAYSPNESLNITQLFKTTDVILDVAAHLLRHTTLMRKDVRKVTAQNTSSRIEQTQHQPQPQTFFKEKPLIPRSEGIGDEDEVQYLKEEIARLEKLEMELNSDQMVSPTSTNSTTNPLEETNKKPNVSNSHPNENSLTNQNTSQEKKWFSIWWDLLSF